MPTLGRSPRSSLTRNAVLAATAAGVLIVTLLVVRARHATPPPAPAPVAAPAPAAGAPQANAATGAAPQAATPPAQPSPSPVEDPLKKAGYRRLSASINGPLETAIVGQVGRELGQPLTQVIVRALVWWVDVPAGLRRGDQLDALIDERSAEPVLSAVRFHSGKTGQTHRAYRFKPDGATFARYYQPDGTELELRLKDSPLDDYEQVTSLLRDGRGHQGVDFKTPVGTPVKAPFDAVVGRKTWNFRMNGNSLELKESGGKHRVALFLHLSEIAGDVKPGSSVARGQVVAQTGNTGHSFAPHLHYQLMSSDNKVIDPFASHETERRALPEGQKAAFATEVRRLDELLDLPVAAR